MDYYGHVNSLKYFCGERGIKTTTTIRHKCTAGQYSKWNLIRRRRRRSRRGGGEEGGGGG
jgi:hypothetical protein